MSHPTIIDFTLVVRICVSNLLIIAFREDARFHAILYKCNAFKRELIKEEYLIIKNERIDLVEQQLICSFRLQEDVEIMKDFPSVFNLRKSDRRKYIFFYWVGSCFCFLFADEMQNTLISCVSF